MGLVASVVCNNGFQTSPRGPRDVLQLCCSPELAHLNHLVKGLMISWRLESGELTPEYIKYMERLGFPEERFENPFLE